MDLSKYKYPAEGYMKPEDYAKMRGISKPTIYEYIKKGRLKSFLMDPVNGAYFADERGKINIDAERATLALTDPSYREQMADLQRKDAAEPRDAGYTKARTGNEIIKLQKAQLELEELKGNLIPVEKVKRETFIMARSLRDQILAIPDRVAAIFSAETDELKIHRTLTDELRGALKKAEEIIQAELKEPKP